MENEQFKALIVGVAKVISGMESDLNHSESNFRNQQRVNAQIKLYAEKLEKLIVNSTVSSGKDCGYNLHIQNDEDKQFLADVKHGRARPPFSWG